MFVPAQMYPAGNADLLFKGCGLSLVRTNRGPKMQILATRYFHSEICAFVFPCGSTSYSNTAATLFSRAHLGDAVW